MWSSNMRYKNKLMNFNDDCIINVVRKVKDDTQFQSLNDTETTNHTSVTKPEITTIKTDVIKVFWMTKTDCPDVYELYDGEKVMISNKIGVALIPDIKTSKSIREVMKNKNVSTSVKVDCCYSEKFKKWYPVKISS